MTVTLWASLSRLRITVATFRLRMRVAIICLKLVYFDSWKMFYFISKSSAAEKAEALAQMKRLDPNNPNVLG